MIVGIVALLIAVLGLVALADLILSLLGVPVNKICLALRGPGRLRRFSVISFIPLH